MTTNTLAAIRERADEIATGKWIYDDALAQIASGKEDQYGSRALEVALFESSSPKYIDMLITNTQALLAIVDALTARAEAAEAALRPFAELLPRYAEYVAECRADDMIYSNLKGWVDWFGVDNDDLVAWCKQAADALEAHAANGESAGNGGA